MRLNTRKIHTKLEFVGGINTLVSVQVVDNEWMVVVEAGVLDALQQVLQPLYIDGAMAS
jgi:hypothetical protein